MVVVVMLVVGACGCGLERGGRQLVNVCVRGTGTKTLGGGLGEGGKLQCGPSRARPSAGEIISAGLRGRKRMKHQGLC
jgi:hypothetical protein